MPRNHVRGIVAQAKASLEGWLVDNQRLCDLKRADFNAGFPYHEHHLQALYLLRYYPAYFAENHLLFERLQEEGLNDPIIESIGCGCLVDAAAAGYVYGRAIPYTGYDINDWYIKAVEVDGRITELRVGDVFEEDHFYINSNVFIFSRSIGDIGRTLERLAPIIAATEFESDTIYICATYRATDAGIAFDKQKLREFAGFFRNYEHEELTLYYPAGERPPVDSGINTVCRWFDHPEVPYCRDLLGRCTQPEQDCPSASCRRLVGASPILRLRHLAFEVLRLRRAGI